MYSHEIAIKGESTVDNRRQKKPFFFGRNQSTVDENSQNLTVFQLF